MLHSCLIFSCKLNKSLTQQLSLSDHENEDSALGEASSKTQETFKLCSEKCHELSSAIEGRGGYTNPFHLLIRKSSADEWEQLYRHQQPAGTDTQRVQQHPSFRAGIHPKLLHPSQILSKPDGLVKNLKELRSQNLQCPRGARRKENSLGRGRAALSAHPWLLGPPCVCQSWARAAETILEHYI